MAWIGQESAPLPHTPSQIGWSKIMAWPWIISWDGSFVVQWLSRPEDGWTIKHFLFRTTIKVWIINLNWLLYDQSALTRVLTKNKIISAKSFSQALPGSTTWRITCPTAETWNRLWWQLRCPNQTNLKSGSKNTTNIQGLWILAPSYQGSRFHPVFPCGRVEEDNQGSTGKTLAHQNDFHGPPGLKSSPGLPHLWKTSR